MKRFSLILICFIPLCLNSQADTSPRQAQTYSAPGSKQSSSLGSYEKNYLPDWFRHLLPPDMAYDRNTYIFSYGDKNYKLNIEDGAGQLIAISPVLFSIKGVRDKTWELLKDEMQNKVVDKTLEGTINNEQDKLYAETIVDALKTGNSASAIAWFTIKTLLKSGDGDSERGSWGGDGTEGRMESNLINAHPEIEIPQSIINGGTRSQYAYVINKLVIKEIMKEKNVNESEAKRIFHATPKIESFLNPLQNGGASIGSRSPSSTSSSSELKTWIQLGSLGVTEPQFCKWGDCHNHSNLQTGEKKIAGGDDRVKGGVYMSSSICEYVVDPKESISGGCDNNDSKIIFRNEYNDYVTVELKMTTFAGNCKGTSAPYSTQQRTQTAFIHLKPNGTNYFLGIFFGAQNVQAKIEVAGK